MKMTVPHDFINNFGVIDGRGTSLAVRVYLLGRDFCVLGAFGAAQGQVGERFFALHPATAPEQGLLEAHFSAAGARALLTTLCGKPALFLEGAYAYTGLLLAVLPEETVQTEALFLPLEGGLCISRALQGELDHHTAAQCAVLQRVYQDLACAAMPLTASHTPAMIIRAFSVYTTRLAALFGVCVHCDFSGITRGESLPEYSLYHGALAALLAVTRRAARERTVACSFRSTYPGELLLCAELELTNPDDALEELAHIHGVFHARGAVFELLRAENAPGRVMLRASLGVPALSVQGVKEKNDLLQTAQERRTPPPCTHNAAAPFELYFDEEMR